MINTYLKFFNNKLVKGNKYINVLEKKSKILIKVKSCGICGSDINILKNGSKRVSNGTIMGHEIAGIIMKFKNNKFVNTNKNVLLGADIPNKKNLDYALGHELDGGFQKYLEISKKNFRNIPHFITSKKINFDYASLCEPLACCLNGFNKINFRKNKTVIIFGAGPIGQLIALICLYNKASKICIVDSNNDKLKIGIKNKKVNKINLKKFKQIKENLSFDYGFVACSSGKAQNEILGVMKENSTVNYFAGIKSKKKVNLVPINTNLIHYKKINIVGSHGSTAENINEAAKLIINKKINFNDIITKSYNINKYKEAFNNLKKGKALKVIIRP